MLRQEYPNVQLQAKLTRHQHYMTVVRNVALVCRGGVEPRQMFQAIHDQLVPVLPFDAFFVALCEDAAATEYHLSFFVDEGRRYEPSDRRIGGLVSYLLEHKQPLLFHNLQEEYQRYGLPQPHTFGQDKKFSKAWMGVPILIGPQAVGVLSIQSYQDNVYDEDDLQLLVALGDLAAIAIENAMLYQAQHELSQSLAARVIARSEELSLLSQIAISFSQGLSLDTLLQQVLELVLRLIGGESGSMYLNRPEGLQRIASITTNDLAVPPAWLPMDGTSLEVLALQTEQIVEELESPSSIFVLPLQTHGQTVGVLTINGAPRDLSDHQRMLLEAAGHQIAVGIENAQLYQAAHTSAHLAQQHAKKLTLVQHISQLINSSLDPQTVLGVAAEQLVKLFGVDHCGIALYNRAGWHGRIVAEHPVLGSLNHPINFDNTNDFESDMQYLGQPIYIADVLQDQRTKPISALVTDLGLRSMLIVPLISRGHAFGAIGLSSRSPQHVFSAEDHDVCQIVAAQVAVALENARLYERGVTRVEQELDLARSIQVNLFPHTLPSILRARLGARCVPARKTGGDFYDVLTLGDDRFAISVGDVSGKSMPAAMLMAVARSIVRSEALDHAAPEMVMSQANALIAQDVPPSAYVALCYAVYDARERTLEMSLAAQMTPLVRRRDGSFYFVEVAGNLPLGMLPTANYTATRIQLMPGDTVLFYTDGIVEAFSPEGIMFGFERLQTTLNSCADASAQQIPNCLFQRINEWQRDTSQHDDQTIVVLQLA
jgi:sigma-B regulation protein RsbU (phosphoserine phosphatase)